MNLIRPIILLAFGGLLLFLAVRSLRAQRLKERYVLLFLAVGAPFLLLALWPDGIVWLSRTLSIEKPTVMVLALAMFLILMIFELLSIVSVQERKISTLSQMVGLLMEKQGMTQRGEQPQFPIAKDGADRKE